MNLGNRITMAVLRSPLHWLMSRSLLILTYEGRRSGKDYALPLQYVEMKGAFYVWAGRPDTKTWWRNFEQPAAVDLRVRGRDITAKGALIYDPNRRGDVLSTYLDRYPYTTATGKPKFFGARWQPSHVDLTEVARTMTMVAFEPT